MKPLYSFVVEPIGDRYNNKKALGDKELILNTEIFNHQYINREAFIKKTPVHNPNNLRENDQVILHHNVFRRWHNVKGKERNGSGFINENEYLVGQDQIFMYKRDKEWLCLPGYTFIKPLKSIDKMSIENERPLIGVVKYSDGTFLPTQLVGFSPGDEFEFVINGERLYRVINKYINIEYEYKGDEEEYNPSWA
jgi:predicted DNA-binding antitoxin AbrB/MazE fold protein